MSETITSINPQEMPSDEQSDNPTADMAEIKSQNITDTEEDEREQGIQDKTEIQGIRAKLGLSVAPDPEKIKKIFLRSFTNEEKGEFVRNFSKANESPKATKLFETNISESLTFVAYKAEESFGGGIMFRIVEGEDIKAQITFNSEEEGAFNMVHREVQSQSLGISGSSLLRKIEEYFKILQESKSLPNKLIFSIEAGQETVAQWALKNGYEFKSAEQEQLFNSIISGQKGDEYVVTNIGDGNLYDSYIFEKDVYSQHEKEIHKDPTLAKEHSVRFTLIRKMQPEETGSP